ncbi:MAG: GLUG motif-containing protein [Sedimentisphaerales bacterium]
MTKARNPWASWVIPLLITICFFSFPAYAQYGGGTGEPNDPYLIYTAEQMNEIGLHQEDWDKHFKLMEDIDLGSFTGTSYNIIGGEWDNPFTGVFDGNNKKISNFNYSSTGRYRAGIFGYIYGPNAEVKDLGLIDPDINGDGSVGSLVGFLRNGVIVNCYAQGGSVSGYDGVGGLVGWGDFGSSTITNCYTTTSVSGNKGIGGLTGSANKITNCYATGDVSGYEDVGGLVGENRFQTITNCYSSASVSGYIFVGGLVGDNQGGSIINCYSNAPTTGTYYVGGLVGDNAVGSITNCYSSTSVTGTDCIGGLAGTNKLGRITDCYSNASATGNNGVGGLVGTNERGRITNCYSIGQVDGLFNVGGLVGYIADNVSASFWDTQTSGQAISASGMGLTTAEMNDPNTFINAGWDFLGVSDDPGGIWAEPEDGGYPILWWQLPKNFGLPAFSGGTGEPNNPYLISTANELNSIGNNPRLMDAYYKLINDIDLTGVDLFSIGANLYPFAGTFDGNDKKISNLSGTQGLFAYVRGEHAHIKDLGLIDPNIDKGMSGAEIGPLVGTLGIGSIINCYAQGGSVSGGVVIGGLVGRNNGSSIASCYSSTSVSGAYTIGGLLGLNVDGTITNCYAKGSVSVREVGAGGLVGMNYAGTIENCYSEGHVQGPNDIGGLVGHNDAGIIKNCYSVGYVQGLEDVGGLIGNTSNDGTVITSFWDAQTSGQANLGGGRPSTGGIPLQTHEMQTARIFLIVGWDFVDEDRNGTEDIWWILEGQDYPRLSWELGDETSP